MGVDFGALVISLDFELHWGIRDVHPGDGGSYRENLLGARAAIPRVLDLFEEHGVAATWATVGFLFAESREELEEFRPRILPAYTDRALFPYDEPVGRDEDDDPLHYAPGLIEAIRRRPGQEIGTHTYSHYYCLEPGQDRAAFQEDLRSAVAIARRRGIEVRSLVFPRNQLNPEYAADVTVEGITCVRSNEGSWIYDYQDRHRGQSTAQRACRIVDAYAPLSGPNLTSWDAIRGGPGPCQVPSSRFLRPCSPRLRHLEAARLRRIASGIRAAARSHSIYHLWWHPHNFGIHTERNLSFLRDVLEVFSACRARHGMRSLSMMEVAAIADERARRAAGGGRALDPDGLSRASEALR